MSLIAPIGRAVPRVAAACLGLMLGGCAVLGTDYSDVKCPGIGVIAGIGTVSRFDGRGTGFVDLADRASLSLAESDCTIDKEGALVTFTVSTAAELGPAASSRTIEFPYFVAVTDARDKIVAKRVFPNSIRFAPDQTRAASMETLTQRIMLSDPTRADRFHVVLGFQLTDAERDYNRSVR